jgi:hypothetical protein
MRTCLTAAALAALLLAGCGEERKPPRPEPVVELTLTGPPDAATTRDDTMAVSGSVAPARASVQVLGEEVAVEGGKFTADVPLEPGANLIDVAASASGRRPDFASLRIVYEQRVELPDVTGRDADGAREELEGLGLDVTTEDAGGFLDPILPGPPKVCEMQPGPGAQVPPGTEVSLSVARDC